MQANTVPGIVESIHVTAQEGGELESLREAQAVPGKGLRGDRYYARAEAGTPLRPDQELTLVEAEAVEAFNREFDKSMPPHESRRNVVTRGVALNDLVGREFQVGEVRVKGLRLCQPCTTLQRLAMPEVIPGMVDRCGLRAQILSGGAIRVGDEVTLPPHG